MLSLFYIVLVIALTSVGLLFYLLFRRRISLTIFRARGYFGVSLFIIAFITLVGCATAVGILGNPSHHSPTEMTDTQYNAFVDWTDSYRSYSDRLQRSYVAIKTLSRAIDDGKLTYEDARYEIDRQTDKALVIKSGFSKLTIDRTLPAELTERMEKMASRDTERYEKQLRLLLSLRQEIAKGVELTPSERITDSDAKHIRLLVLDQLPAHTNANAQLYALRQDVLDTYRQRHTK